MANFTIRVVLNGNASWEHYDKLHKAMAARGFLDEISADDGTVYKLPDAEYVCTKTMTAERVRESAKAAADSVWTNNTIFVTEAVRWVWTNLSVVRPARRA